MKSFNTLLYYCFIVLCAGLAISCNNEAGKEKTDIKSDSLSEEQKHLPENALKGLTIADGLEVHAFATEPMLKNPTDIDVDERGRVWVCEAYNYRPAINGNPTNALGDRIMILQDNDGDEDPSSASRNSPLSAYTVNLNEQASDGRTDPLIGREKEIERAARLAAMADGSAA